MLDREWEGGGRGSAKDKVNISVSQFIVKFGLRRIDGDTGV